MTSKSLLQFILLCSLFVLALPCTGHLKDWKWSKTFPPEFATASRAPAHAAEFKMKKYKYRSTGKMADFLEEVGKPDFFSRQSFCATGVDHPVYIDKQHQSGKPEGSFKYVFQDKMVIYIETGNMQTIALALLYKDKRLVSLLYK